MVMSGCDGSICEILSAWWVVSVGHEQRCIRAYELLNDGVDRRGVVPDVGIGDLDDAFAFAGGDGGRHREGEKSEGQLAVHPCWSCLVPPGVVLPETW